MSTYGIDLGTTYSCIARLDSNGNPEVIRNNEDDSNMVASVVFFENENNVVVGQAAKENIETDGDRVVQFVKREIGKRDMRTYTFDGKTYTPVEISALILTRLKNLVESQGNEIEDVVITVPAYFGLEERSATKQAGELAGLHVLSLINEPTAAALSYCARQFQEDRTILVYDLGGGTFDVTVVKMSMTRNEAGKDVQKINVLATGGDDRLGGDNFDKIIQQKLIRNIEDDMQIMLDDADTAMLDETEFNKLMNRLLIEARKIKEGLSETEQYEINLPNFARFDGKDYSLDFTMTRAEFDEICKPLYDKIFTKLNHFAKENNNFWLDEIGHVIMAGGSCYIPYIRERIASDLGIVPDSDLDMSRLVVIGAARVAEAKNTGIAGGGIELQSVLAHSLGVEVMAPDGRMIFDRILAKDTPYPCAATREYETAFDNQTRIDVNVYEAGAENELDLKFHRYRGTLSLQNLPAAPRGETFVDVRFEYTEDQRLKVTATDLQRENHFEEQILSKSRGAL